MPRSSRLVVSGEPTAYHITSHTALDGSPFGDAEKDYLLASIKRLSALFFTEVVGFCLLDSHFQLLVRVLPGGGFADKEVLKRLAAYYGEERAFEERQLPAYRDKLAKLSEYMREIKVQFTRYYNRRKGRTGYFWGERFKSVIIDSGEPLVGCMALIDLLPMREGLVQHPGDYRWSSLGYHQQTGNRDGFLSTDFGMPELDAKNEKERVRLYLRHVDEVRQSAG